jgi:hypothetical protein
MWHYSCINKASKQIRTFLQFPFLTRLRDGMAKKPIKSRVLGFAGFFVFKEHLEVTDVKFGKYW